MNKLNRLTSKITAVMSLSVIVGLGGMTIFGNKNGKSFSENRELTKFTKPSFETVYDGRSAEQLDGYFTDHFTDRSKWLYFKSLIEAEVSESIVNGVYVSSERLLDTENTHLNEKMLSYNADIINNFAKKYDGTAYFVAVPRIAAIHIQKRAPGPPATSAVATPTILPVPIVAERAVQRAAKPESSPFPSFSLKIDLKARPNFVN